MEHFFHNAHGEWDFIFMCMGSLPFIGLWFRTKFKTKGKKKCTCYHEEN